VDPQDRLALGPQLSSHARFPRQINVEFARVHKGLRGPEIHVDVFERGCGWTLACGTGATATVHAALRLGLVAVGQAVPVRLPGGWLTIEIRADGSAIMRGPAEEVFEGTVEIDVDPLTTELS
jgi:diaminopimelate epimerase